MTMFCDCGYPMRIAYMTFLIITILTLMFLLWLLIRWKCGQKRIALWASVLVICFTEYTILLDDHIMPIDPVSWHAHKDPFPIAILWLCSIAVFVAAGRAIEKTNSQYKNSVTEENIKEALDEVPLAICGFKDDGVPLLCNRRMRRISEILGDKIFISYSELQEMLSLRDEWREPGDFFRFPDGTICRYAEEEIVTADGEHYLISYFFDFTELTLRRTELEEQNEELRRMSVELQILKENTHLLAKEEEILSIKTRWHDVMGEGLTAVRRALLKNQSQEATDGALRRWCEAVTTIQRDNDDPDQRRDAVGDLLRDAQGLQIQLEFEGELPSDKETQRVFIFAVRNCLLNAAQHAKATELYSQIFHTEDEDILTVRNNGIQPECEIVPRGGLINVKTYAEHIGGRAEIQSMPYFELKVAIPRKEDGAYPQASPEGSAPTYYE